MASGRPVPAELRDSILKSYFSGEKTIKRLSIETGVSRRAIYQWIEDGKTRCKYRHKRTHRRQLLLSLEEVELLLLMCCECDSILKKPDRAIMRGIEERLLTISDELYTLAAAAGEKVPY